MHEWNQCVKCKKVFDKCCNLHKIVHERLCNKCEEDFSYILQATINDFLQIKSDGIIQFDYFPPPWDFTKFPEKTEGWVEFQKEMQKHPEYYLCKSAVH